MHQPPYRAEALTAPDLPCPDPGGAARLLPPGRASAPPSPTPDDIPTLVALHGELDFPSAARVRDQLGEALAASPSGLELDLSGLAFCDCAGLNVLLEIRHRALTVGKTFTVQAASAAVDRLLEVVGVQELLSSKRPRSMNPRHGGPVTAPQSPCVGVQHVRRLSLRVSDPA
ncbi:STAS domain-containing protein [Streptomyces sp. NPDC096324]|uniref:STAS domain-containing protein n=1 Tax=Streptomyces sp. NPDC096324 TaxID=3366085 RepID=UPI0038045673